MRQERLWEVEELKVLRDYLFEWNEMEGKREEEEFEEDDICSRIL
jgi:hypothetical protein